MTDHHLPPEDRRRIERRLLWSAIFKYAAVFVAAVWMVATTIQQQHTTQAIRDTQTEGSPLLLAIQSQADEIQKAVDAAVATNEQLADCLTPGGKCARAAKQQRAVFLQIVGLNVACAVGKTDLPDAQRIEATNECVATWTRDHPDLFGQQQ